MSEADILAWCVPLALAAISGVFLVLGVTVPGGVSWGIAYALAAIGYATAVFPGGDYGAAKAIFEDSLFLFAMMAMARGISQRFQRRPHDCAALAVVALTLVVAGLALVFYDSVPTEIAAVQTGCAAFALFAATRMWGNLQKPVNRALFALALLLATNLLAQNVWFLLDPSPQLTMADWRQSSWAFFFQLGGIAFGLLFAFTALIAIGLDAVERYRVSSETDLLSGLLNRRGFELQLRAATERREAEGALVLIDVDHFKAVNDRNGHAAGDMVIAGLGALLGLFADRLGFAGRMGGEEFAIFVEGADTSAGAARALEIREALKGVAWPLPLVGIQITASFGVAAARPGESFESAYRRADDRLYQAKQAGRDCVIAAAMTVVATRQPGAVGSISRVA
ncbi:GGDEF domain-containing protein [Aurantimonas marina]|uniref:GGDEF domain-containing protein n=1 Tax=Aurantimonas marina TaxID=2780508 RepID=UPI0019D0FF93|nr:GGDEF domain-containing protein [Aurantimonas marina]